MILQQPATVNHHPQVQAPIGGVPLERLRARIDQPPAWIDPRSPPLRYCPRVRSLIGYHTVTGQTRIIPIRCRCWKCTYCRPLNVERLRKRTLTGKPNRIVTLTVRPQYPETPQQCHDRVRPCINRLFTRLRKLFGSIEYAAFLEETKRGWPHWHVLVRSNYIPQHKIANIWQDLTGAFVVDVRRIQDPDRTAAYVTKYVTKLVGTGDKPRLGRIVGFSKQYLIREQTNPTNPEWRWWLDKAAPWTVAQRYKNGELLRIEDGSIWFDPPVLAPVASLSSVELLQEGGLPDFLHPHH